MPVKMNKNLTVHMVGHAHIDPTWLWRWTEGYEEVRATFRSALDRMKETPEFKFSASSACFYSWIKSCDPHMFEEIRKRVKEGRWELAGGWWVEPDCNIPGGEAIVRHGLYSQRFFQKEFGKRATVGFNPDSFGHAGTYPQLLKKMGIDYYAYMRPCPVWERQYPDGTTFVWRANDGSEVIACNLQEGYNEEEDVRRRIGDLCRNQHLNAGQKHVLGFYGVGNHGGGPTKRAIATLLEMQQEKGPEVRFSTMTEFFNEFEATSDRKKMPVIDRDLQHHARGCYSVHSEIKRLNRQLEHTLMTAERFAVAAWLLEKNYDYPEQVFEYCWGDVLYNQFHDILAGTSIESSYQDTRDQMGAARHRAHVIQNEAIQTIARGVDTTAEGNTIIVINPLTWPVTQTVAAPPITARCLQRPLHIVDDTEQVVASQQVLSERIDSNEYIFTAELPALGYRCYHARSGAVAVKPKQTLAATQTSLENDWWRIEFDPYDGQITRLYDKTAKVETLRRGNILAAMVDSSDTWSHGYDEFRVEDGRFGNARLEVFEMGDVRATLRITSTYGKSTVEQFVSLHRAVPTIDCTFRVNWQERYRMLKLGWETLVNDGVATYDTAYGCQVRDTEGFEEPGQMWFDLTGEAGEKPYGFAVLNDSKYGFDVRGNIMRVTVLRSPAYAHHDRARYDASLPYSIMDQGWQTLRIQLLPHAGAWQDAGVVKRAWELNEPAFTHVESAHTGHRSQSASLMGTEAEDVLLSVIKKAEDCHALIIRGYETAGRNAKTTLHFPYWKKAFAVEFAPHEIKTLRIDLKTWTIKEVNLLEE